jgi:hypothetical protein
MAVRFLIFFWRRSAFDQVAGPLKRRWPVFSASKLFNFEGKKIAGPAAAADRLLIQTMISGESRPPC